MPKLSRALALCLLLLCVIGLAATLSRSQAEEPPHRLWMPVVYNPARPTLPPPPTPKPIPTSSYTPAAPCDPFPLEASVSDGVRYSYGFATKFVTNTTDIALVPLCSYHLSWFAAWVGGGEYVGQEYLPELGPLKTYSSTWQAADDITIHYYYYDYEGFRPECPMPTPRPQVAVTATRPPVPTMTPAP